MPSSHFYAVESGKQVLSIVYICSNKKITRQFYFLRVKTIFHSRYLCITVGVILFFKMCYVNYAVVLVE